MTSRRERLNEWQIGLMEGERDKDPTNYVGDTFKRPVLEISKSDSKKKYQMISFMCEI